MGWQAEANGCEAYKACWFWRHCKTPQCEYHVVWTKRGQGKGFRIYMVVSLWQDSAQKRLAHSLHGTMGGHRFYIKKTDVLCRQWDYKGCNQIFTRNENFMRHLKEERCTEGRTKVICSSSKFKHILNSFEKVFYGGDTKFKYTACQWIEAQAMKTGKHIHHKMCGHGRECMVKVWVLS